MIPRTMVAIGMVGFTLVDTMKLPAPGVLGFLAGVLGAP
jgi:hypothetical protein